jgi:hypothetical protein
MDALWRFILFWYCYVLFELQKNVKMKFQAYDETTIRNLQIQITAKELLHDGRLTLPQYKESKKAFPINFKQGNLFVRVGLFLFTSLCIGFSILLIMWMTGGIDSGEKSVGSLLLFFGVTLAVLNEYFIRERQWYRQGSDNAFCYAVIICLSTSFSILLGLKTGTPISVLVTLLMTIAAVRYGDPLLAFGAFYGLIYAFLFAFDATEMPQMVLPFVCAATSLAVYFFAKNGLKKVDWFYWEDCFKVLEIAGLAGFYGFINYNVVDMLLHNDPEVSIPKPFNFIFAFLTAVVPLVYLAYGILKKDRILWILGGLGIVASILTYRIYHSIMPLEWALTLAGIVLLALAIILMQYLKTPHNGFSYEPKRQKNNALESLIVSQLLHQTPSNTEGGIEYGGGDFGGGGASGEF